MEILGITIWQVLKVFILIFLALYIIFAIVVIRQIGLMVKTIYAGLEGRIKLLGYFHLLFAIAVFVFAIIIL